MVNNHGDRKSPIPGVVPLTNGRTSWLINGGDPNHLLTGVILQVGLWLVSEKGCSGLLRYMLGSPPHGGCQSPPG